jgi:hypothetical protein
MDEPSTNKQLRPEAEDFESDYANNTFFNSSIWDLKIIFGELSGVRQGVDWHTAITLPWAQAKLMAYYLAINIAGYELEHGPIRIPSAMIPTEPPPPDKDFAPSQKALYEFVKAHRQKFLDDLDK